MKSALGQVLKSQIIAMAKKHGKNTWESIYFDTKKVGSYGGVNSLSRVSKKKRA